MRDYEILFDLPEGEYRGREVGGIRTKTVRSGKTLEVMCYPIVRLSQEARRERKRRKTTEAMTRINARNTQRRIMRLIEGNFTEGDHVLTLTYEYPTEANGFYNADDLTEAYARAGVPNGIEDAARDFRNFMDRVKRAVRRRGGDPKGVMYLDVIESGKERLDGLPPKYHIHCVIHAPELSARDMEEIWGRGFTRDDGLKLSFDGAARLSKYFTKQRRYERRWGHSRNLKEPEEKVSDRKISRRRAAKVAEDVRQFGREIFEKVYPGYRCVEDPAVSYSDYVAGAYIYARMRRRD